MMLRYFIGYRQHLYDVVLFHSLACSQSIVLTRHNQESAQWSPDPFPRERVGSGHETIGYLGRQNEY